MLIAHNVQYGYKGTPSFSHVIRVQLADGAAVATGTVFEGAEVVDGWLEHRGLGRVAANHIEPQLDSLIARAARLPRSS